MTSPARHQPADGEVQLLAALKNQYLAQGFSFEIEPDPQQVPPFLGTYRPDAIARKAGANVAIEIRQRRTPQADLTLREIRQRFDGHPDWQFLVAYTAEDPLKSLSIAASPASEIRERLRHVRALEANGELRAAFILGWSLLEATLQSIESSAAARPRTPGTVVQTLAMLGYIAPEAEQRMRPLIPLRNRMVHGDLAAEPSAADVECILSIVEEIISEV
jgi:uncharacterized protein YutE (UPF0331/DUF86 family)